MIKIKPLLFDDKVAINMSQPTEPTSSKEIIKTIKKHSSDERFSFLMDGNTSSKNRSKDVYEAVDNNIDVFKRLKNR